MRTHEQIVEEVRRVLGIPCVYSEWRQGTFALFGPCGEPEIGVYDQDFASYPEYIQDVILLHEKGHIEADRTGKPAHTAQRMLRIQAMGTLYYSIEAEADLYAAEKIGLDKMVEVIRFTHQFPWDHDNGQTRINYLTAAWNARSK